MYFQKFIERRLGMEKTKVPIWQKYTLTVVEAATYFNIGETKLRRILSENTNADYVLMNGSKLLIKRKIFENVIDGISAI